MTMILAECSTCDQVVTADALAQYSAVLDRKLGTTERITFARCRKCASPVLMGEQFYGTEEGKDLWSHPHRMYPPRDELLRPRIPSSVRGPYKEAISCYKAQAYTAATMMCRRTIEAACAEHDVHETPLSSALAEMEALGAIEARLYEWGIALTQLTHAREGETVFRDEARDALEFTDAFLAYVYAFRDRFQGFLKRRSAKAPERPVVDEPAALTAVAAGAASAPVPNGDQPS